jgi:hypothetical protein
VTYNIHHTIMFKLILERQYLALVSSHLSASTIYTNTALIFPGLLGGIPAPAIIANTGSNCVYLAMVGCVGYALISNLSGKVPDKIPLISDAAGMQVP